MSPAGGATTRGGEVVAGGRVRAVCPAPAALPAPEGEQAATDNPATSPEIPSVSQRRTATHPMLPGWDGSYPRARIWLVVAGRGRRRAAAGPPAPGP
jgi:hypothetical protein